MDGRFRHGVLTLALVAAAPSLVAQTPSPQSAEVSADAIAEGKKLYAEKGLCLACHGAEGKAGPGSIGPALADAVWLHGTGTYPEIVSRILAGVSIDSTKTGQIMPPRGGSSLKEAEVRAVAAYVWSISRPPEKDP